MPIAFSYTVFIVIISILILLFCAYEFLQIRLFLIFLCFILFGFYSATIVSHKYYAVLGNQNIVGVITSQPEEKPKTYKVEFTVYQNADIGDAMQSKAMLYIQKDSLSKKLSYGDIIVCDAVFKEITNHANSSFDYKAFMNNKFLYSQAFVTTKNWQKIGVENSFLRTCNNWRQRVIHVFLNENISTQNFNLLAALVFGDKTMLDEETSISFGIVGAMHILSVSGLHVAIISTVLLWLLSCFKKNKWLPYKVIICVTGIWAYACITGLCPSVQRAAIMCCMISISSLLKRNVSTYNSLACAAFISLCIHPFDLFDVGFQLSYLAVLSILYFAQFFQNLLRFQNVVYAYVWGILAVSVAVQIGTLPISLYYFKIFPTYTFVANCLIIPISFVALTVSIITLCIASVPIVGQLSLQFLNFILEYMRDVVLDIASFPYSKIVIEITMQQMLVTYCILIIGILVYEYKKYLRVQKQLIFY